MPRATFIKITPSVREGEKQIRVTEGKPSHKTGAGQLYFKMKNRIQNTYIKYHFRFRGYFIPDWCGMDVNEHFLSGCPDIQSGKVAEFGHRHCLHCKDHIPARINGRIQP